MSFLTREDKYGIECNTINDRKRFLYLYNRMPLKDYTVSAVPCLMTKERALQLMKYVAEKREKCTPAELRLFEKRITYMKLIEFDDWTYLHTNDPIHPLKEIKNKI